MSFLLSSYLGDQRGKVNVVDVVVAVVPVAEEDDRDAVYESSVEFTDEEVEDEYRG
ncbi:hypothetical protein CEP53_006316 [Fusarium sp. AF-6]|nr:hypothetical protein CEP53_006316 [Fusarium sp. AF-6]